VFLKNAIILKKEGFMKAKLWKTLTVLFMVLVVFMLFFTFAVGGRKEEVAPEGVPLNDKGEVIHIAAVDWPQFQPYKVRQEAEERAVEDYGVKHTLLHPTEVTVEAAVETFMNAVNQGFDAIIMEPWSYEPYLEAFTMAKERGIPCVNVHVPYDDPSFFIAQIYIDNTGFGKTSSEIINRETGGKANVLMMMNNPDIVNQAIIRQTFIDECADKYPGIKVVATEFTQVDPIIAVERLEAAFTAYPEIDTVMFLESATVTMAADVAKEMGILDQVRIIGIDDPPDLITSIRNNEVWGSFNQNFTRQGYEAIRVIVDYYLGNPFPHQTDAGIVLITKDNVDDYIPSMWAPVALKGKPYPNL
jgi:ribose transport system substrate-binding protein